MEKLKSSADLKYKKKSPLSETGGLITGSGSLNEHSRLGGSIFRLPSSIQKIFTSPKDLVSRFKLLGGSIQAGNNNKDLLSEFIDIAHKLRDLGMMSNSQLLSILKSLNWM